MPEGESIVCENGELRVPRRPIIPYIEGDGVGPDIWRAASRVMDAAVEKAYGGGRALAWLEVLAGEKAFAAAGEWLPAATLDAFRRHLVGIKGPLTTPVGGGVRSLNVALRQALDLYVCLRPVSHFPGVPSPVKRPELVDMTVFRENTEDIYAGVEFQAGTPECEKFIQGFAASFPELAAKIRFPGSSSIGVKPISREGSARLIRAAIRHAVDRRRKSVTLVHKGNIMKFTEGGFRDWGYEVADREFGARPLDGGPWREIDLGDRKLIVKDVIADAFLQQILTRPGDYDVIATPNLNGDYISDALAAQVGGIGIAPGGNLNCLTGHSVFEATHGTAPKYAGKDMVNPSSVILSGEMMLRRLGWDEAADLIISSMRKTLAEKRVTYDFHRLMDGASLLSCSGFGDALIGNL